VLRIRSLAKPRAVSPQRGASFQRGSLSRRAPREDERPNTHSGAAFLAATNAARPGSSGWVHELTTATG
jgi:hypothetical protein